MIVILSPAKIMNFRENCHSAGSSIPEFIKEAKKLIEKLKEFSPPELASLMKTSDEIAEESYFKNLRWKREHDALNSKQAAFTYDGIVFKALNAKSFSEKELDFAQKHLRILSGLYGVLRPLDIIQPYRLEMGHKLCNSKGKDLYCFWKDQITKCLNEEIVKYQDNNFLLNLASQEYSSAINEKSFKGRIINVTFKDYKRGEYKVVTVNAKRARGLMAKFVIENRLDVPEGIKEFQEEGYQYVEEFSKDNNWVFLK